MGEEELLVIPMATGQVIPTKGAVFEARCRLANYLQQVNATLDWPLHSLTRDSTTPDAVYKAILTAPTSIVTYVTSLSSPTSVTWRQSSATSTESTSL